jgi:16S rRNA G966 N2-methylase RsmD
LAPQPLREEVAVPDNILYYGDNLDVLQLHIKDESVDLIYLDPPFKSNVDYNAFFEEKDGTKAAAQTHAFEDTWQWDAAAARQYQETIEQSGRVSEVLRASLRCIRLRLSSLPASHAAGPVRRAPIAPRTLFSICS